MLAPREGPNLREQGLINDLDHWRISTKLEGRLPVPPVERRRDRRHVGAEQGDQDGEQRRLPRGAGRLLAAILAELEALSGSRDYEKAKRLIAEAGYKGERVVVLDAADIPHFTRSRWLPPTC